MGAIAQRTLGVEEEFHLVDPETRYLTPRSIELLRHLPTESFVPELQQCTLEINSAVASTLTELHSELASRRRQLIAAASTHDIGIAAAGAMPLATPSELGITPEPRYQQILDDYQQLVFDQLICGSQVHVGVASRDEAVRIASRLTPYLPTLLALSASSPFTNTGADAGYASMRTMLWRRWPTTGIAPSVHSAAEYDALVAELVASGVIADGGMVYFDIRPALIAPTLELRICDSCPSIDMIILIAGLYRALVVRAAQNLESGQPAIDFSPTLARAARWRAARSGLEGELIGSDRQPKPAAEVVRQLLTELRPHLEEAGDWEIVSDLTSWALRTGSSARQQREVLEQNGRLTDVVDYLMAATAAGT